MTRRVCAALVAAVGISLFLACDKSPLEEEVQPPQEEENEEEGGRELPPEAFANDPPRPLVQKAYGQTSGGPGTPLTPEEAAQQEREEREEALRMAGGRAAPEEDPEVESPPETPTPAAAPRKSQLEGAKKASEPQGALDADPHRGGAPAALSWTGQDCSTPRQFPHPDVFRADRFNDSAYFDSGNGYRIFVRHTWHAKDVHGRPMFDALGKPVIHSNGGCSATQREYIHTAMRDIRSGLVLHRLMATRDEQWHHLDDILKSSSIPKVFSCAHDCPQKADGSWTDAVTNSDVNLRAPFAAPWTGEPGEQRMILTAMNPKRLASTTGSHRRVIVLHELLHWTDYANAQIKLSEHDLTRRDYIYAMARIANGCVAPFRSQTAPNDPKAPIWPGGPSLQQDCLKATGTNQEKQTCGTYGRIVSAIDCGLPYGANTPPWGVFQCGRRNIRLSKWEYVAASMPGSCKGVQRYLCGALSGTRAKEFPPPYWAGMNSNRVASCQNFCQSSHPEPLMPCTPPPNGPPIPDHVFLEPNRCKQLPQQCMW